MQGVQLHRTPVVKFSGVFLAEVQLLLVGERAAAPAAGTAVVTISCLSEAALARAHFTRFCEQMERDVRRSGRAWKRRLAQAQAAGGGGGSGGGGGGGGSGGNL